MIRICIILSALLSIVGFSLHGQSSTMLWYDSPAQEFEQTLALGNGRMGAALFGGVEQDKIYLNDITLWSGEPVNPYMRADAHTNIKAIRDALAKEDYPLADRLQRGVQGKFSEAYMPAGTLFIENIDRGRVSDYRRELDLSKAEARVTFKINGVGYCRDYFVSHPDSVMVIRLTCDKKGGLNFNLRLDSQLAHTISTEKRTVIAEGYAPIHSRPNYRGNSPGATIYDPNRGTRFTSLVNIASTDGKVVRGDSTVGVRSATHAVVVVSIATSFNGFDKNPATEGRDNKLIARKQLKNAAGKSYSRLLKSHTIDYQSFFKRVDLYLGDSSAEDLPTDQRLKRYATGAEDKNLEILYFQFGRYLLISSSRTHGVPANLQGVWNPHIRPPWSSNYTININLQENYWLAESANLSEMNRPLLSFIGNIAKTGEVTAKTFLGVKKGWTACHNSDIWAMSNPVGDFGNGHPVWANWYMGGVWLATHLWDHYQYSLDKQWLRDEAYPLMKGSAEFCMEWLIEDKNGHLITSPSTSPENMYITDKGYRGATLYGATADVAMSRQIISQTLSAARLLDVDAELCQRMESTLKRLLPYKIGADGSLQEWYHDWADLDPKHRHQTHLFGLYPADQISPRVTPDLAKACRRALEIKGDESTGWSKGWRINLWARLLDGDRAYKMIRELMRYIEPDALRIEYAGGGTYPNLFDAHPPFQIDGNFGGAAAFVEMLLQSDEKGNIYILPALPSAWSEGRVKGLCAKGGFVVDIEWQQGKAVKTTIESKSGQPCTVHFADKTKTLNIIRGERAVIEI